MEMMADNQSGGIRWTDAQVAEIISRRTWYAHCLQKGKVRTLIDLRTLHKSATKHEFLTPADRIQLCHVIFDIERLSEDEIRQRVLHPLRPWIIPLPPAPTEETIRLQTIRQASRDLDLFSQKSDAELDALMDAESPESDYDD